MDRIRWLAVNAVVWPALAIVGAAVLVLTRPDSEIYAATLTICMALFGIVCAVLDASADS